jgi:hypothetical protein
MMRGIKIEESRGKESGRVHDSREEREFTCRQLFDIRAIGLLLILLAVAYRDVPAQTSIFNVPTTDVLPPQKLTVEADYIAHPAPYDKAGFQYFGPVIIYGLRKNVEVGFNAFYTLSSEPDAAEIQPNVKWQFFNDEESGVAAAVGGILIIPLKNRETTKTKALLYANISQQIRGKYGPRLTSGAYSFIGPMDEGETRGGLLLGLEQPLHSKLTFVADWYTGYNVFGYAAAGLGLTLPKESYLYAGYSFGNRGRGNNWLGIYFGRTF